MDEPQGGPSAPDDTAAFQRFYAQAPTGQTQTRGLLYRVLIGWWRDRP